MYRWHSCCPQHRAPLNVTLFFHTGGALPPSQVSAAVFSRPSRRAALSILYTPLHPCPPLLSPRLSGRHGGTQSPTDSNHRLHLREEGRGGVRRGRRGGEEKSIQHQTMAYRPRGAVCRKVTAIHYVWWPANGQCACRQMDCKHLPCVSMAWAASGGFAHAR